MSMNIQSNEMSQNVTQMQNRASMQSTKQVTTVPHTEVHNEKNVAAEQKTTHKESSTDSETKENLKEKQLLSEIERSSGKIEVENKGLEFAIHEGTNRIMVRVINEKTKEVVREIPPEKVLNMIAKIIDLSGIFVDEKR